MTWPRECTSRIMSALRARWVAALLILAGIAAAVIVVCGLGIGEPRYQSKRLGAWLADLDFENSQNRAARDRAADAVRAIGTNGLARLTQMLCAEDALLKTLLTKTLEKQSIFGLRPTPARVTQSRAALGYAALGRLAAPNVPELMRLMRTKSNPQVRAYIAVALGSIGPEANAAIPILLKGTQDLDQEVRNNCLLALAEIQRKSSQPERM
jgi:HEAT repeat protein